MKSDLGLSILYFLFMNRIGVLTARPVLACGSMFEILPDSPVRSCVSLLTTSSL